MGVLKENYRNFFEPELPFSKINVIEGLSIGTVNKILVHFPTKWWPDDCQGFSFLWSEIDRKNLIKEFPIGPVLV